MIEHKGDLIITEFDEDGNIHFFKLKDNNTLEEIDAQNCSTIGYNDFYQDEITKDCTCQSCYIEPNYELASIIEQCFINSDKDIVLIPVSQHDHFNCRVYLRCNSCHIIYHLVCLIYDSLITEDELINTIFGQNWQCGECIYEVV